MKCNQSRLGFELVLPCPFPTVIYLRRDFVSYILPFSLVRLRTFRLVHGLVRCTHWVQVFTRARGRCDHQRKPQIENRTGDLNDVMPGRAKDFGIWKKKTVSWDLNSEQQSWDSSLVEGGQFLVSPRRDQLGTTKCAARLLKKLCLSLLMSKNLKLKKVIKSFVPEPILRVFGFLYVLWTLWKFFYKYEYFTYSYLAM